MGFKPPAYTQTPNEIFDEWLPKLKLVELRVLMVIIRKTFGWHKIKDQLSTTQLCTLTGSHREDVINAANSLHGLGLIQKEVVGDCGEQKTFYSLVIDETPSEIPTTPRSELGTAPSRNNRPTKETLTKEKKEKAASASSPSSSKPEKTKEESVMLASNVKIKESQRPFLLEKAKGDQKLFDRWVDKLSVWKADKGVKGCNNDFKSLMGWVADAVSEDEEKAISPLQNKVSKNEVLAAKVEKLNDFRVRVTSTYVEFIHSPTYSIYVGMNENGFREQILNNLRKFNISVGGL